MRRAKSATADCSSWCGGTAVASASNVTGADAMQLSLVENEQHLWLKTSSALTEQTPRPNVPARRGCLFFHGRVNLRGHPIPLEDWLGPFENWSCLHWPNVP